MEHMQLIYLTEVYLVSGWRPQARTSYYLAFFNNLKKDKNVPHVLQNI